MSDVFDKPAQDASARITEQHLALWLDTLEIERRALKMRLSQYDDILVRFGRLKHQRESSPEPTFHCLSEQ